MESEYINIDEFLSGAKKRFVIPVYQRDYSWRTTHCNTLWQDINKLVDSPEKTEHFIGTLVVVNHSKGERIIVDGQQRLTTVSLFLLAMHKFLKQKSNKNKDEIDLQNSLLEEYLILKNSSEERRVRLKPNKQDQVNFDKLFEDIEITENNSNIVNNYNFFYKKIKESNICCLKLFEAFEKLSIVVIELDPTDNAQVIFESLNSTGLDLNSYDLARNYILMNLKPEQQETIYNRYWKEIERNTGSDVAEFIRNFLIYFNDKKIKKEDIYQEFKKYAHSKNNDKEEISKELLRFSSFYSQILQINKFGNSKIDNALTNLIQREGTDFKVCICFLFDVFDNYKNSYLNELELLKIIQTLESYAIRKFIVSNSKQGLNSWFPILRKKIKEATNKGYSYFDAFNHCIVSNDKHTYKFYDDDEFLKALMHKEIYGNYSAKHLFATLENHNHFELVATENLEIEHIMPGKITDEWRQKLGENWQSIHKKYLNTLGNLSFAPPKENKKIGNKNFNKKKEIVYGISKLKLYKDVVDNEKWGEAEILQRAKLLAEEALQIWKYPAKSTLKIDLSNNEEDGSFDLSTDETFTNKKPQAIFFENEEKKVTSWRDFLIEICKFFDDLSPTEFNLVMQDLPGIFADQQNKDRLREPKEFSPGKGKYVQVHGSADDIIKTCQKICEKMNYDPEKIEFTLRV